RFLRKVPWPQEANPTCMTEEYHFSFRLQNSQELRLLSTCTVLIAFRAAGGCEVQNVHPASSPSRLPACRRWCTFRVLNGARGCLLLEWTRYDDNIRFVKTELLPL
ncbi:unnamed protein product, partial [Pylaiella littoralis]